MIYMLDACAMIAYLQREPGTEAIAESLAAPANESYAHTVNLCEVFYDVWRRGGEPAARRQFRT
jgi:uncharacterized protein with PIN domain